MHLLALVILSSLASAGYPSHNVPTIPTTSGPVHGVQLSPEVFSYRGIPYAQPPVGPLRFRAPQPLQHRRPFINATSFGLSCYQPPFPLAADFPPGGFEITTPESEDCLTLNVWTPTERKKKDLLPVLVFIHGGGLFAGGTSMRLHNPWRLVRGSEIVVVTMNYRVGFLGFGHSTALPEGETNIGILDQRLALEWVRKNIGAFGGDPGKITLSGQSAGSGSTDIHAHVYTKDPIVRAFIMMSGQGDLFPGAPSLPGNADPESKGFRAIAEAVGCRNDGDDRKELECLRQVKMEKIQEALKATGLLASAFVDNKVILSPEEFVKRGKEGNFAKLPTLLGSTDHEADVFRFVTPPTDTEPANYTLSDLRTKEWFTCPASRAARDRSAAGVLTFRYRWVAVFPSSLFISWLRAYHIVDLLWLFETFEDLQLESKPRENELEAAKYIQKVWVEFVKDPQKGLKKLGWPRYQAQKNTLVELFPGNKPLVEFVEAEKYDGGC